MSGRGVGRPSIRQSVVGARVGGDLNVIGQYTTLEVSRREFRLVPFTPGALQLPPVDQTRAQPSRLLDARLEVVGFTRRDRELAVLHAWREQRDGAQSSAFLIYGEGGSGKTRLSRQFARLSIQGGWAAWEARYDRAASLTPLPEILLARRQRGRLLLVDYAERWPAAQLLALAQHFSAASGEQPVRMLLLSRAASDWWEVLSHRLNRAEITTQARHMQPLSAGPRGAARLFTLARDRFAEVLQVPGAAQIEVPDLSHDDFGLVLAVHMAALVAVDARLRGLDSRLQPDSGRESGSELGREEDLARLSAYLLRRERDAWHSLPPAESQRPRSSGKTLGRTAYAAILAGPVPRRDAEDVLARARLAGTPELAAELLDDHRALYPPRHPGTDLEPMYPDRLAEDFLALATPSADRNDSQAGGLADPWAADMPTALLAPANRQATAPAWARTGMTVLIQAAVRWRHIRMGYLYPLLRTHPELATEAGSAALATLVELDDLDPEVIDAIEPLLSEGRDFELDLVMAALTQRAARRRLAAATDPPDQARLHVRFGKRYSSAGLSEQALTEYQQAADAYRALAEGDLEEYRAGLADALNRLAIEHAFLNHPPDLALALTREAAGLLRLADPDTEGYLKRLVPVLQTLGDRLSPGLLGRQEEALAIREEAVALARQLVDLTGAVSDGGVISITSQAITARAGGAAVPEDQEDSLRNLATGLTGLSSSLQVVGRTADAVPAAHEGVALARHLAGTHRNRYLGLLAWALGNLAEALHADGQNTAWLTAARESVDLYRLLAKANPNVYLDPLAGALSRYGNALTGNGQHAEAQDATEESLAIRRDLAKADPALHGIMCAAALCDYSDWLARSRQNAQATAAAREALALVESLPDLEPGYIAMATMTLGKRLTSPEDAAEGRALSKAAISLYREPGADTETGLLADSLGTLASQELALDHVAEAKTAAEQAVSLMRPLALEGQDRHMRTLAWALQGLAIVLDSRPETQSAAVLAMGEAVDIHRTVLSQEDPQDLFGFATRQSRLVSMLCLAERDAEALPLAAEVVETARACVAASPGPEQTRLLFGALYNLAWTRWRTKQELPEAADALDELARLLRHPPDDDTLAFPDIANTLRVRALILTSLGRLDEARDIQLAAQAAESTGQHCSEALAPGRPVMRRLFSLADMVDLSHPRGAEALAVSAVTAGVGTWERGLARGWLRLRRWGDRHRCARWFVGKRAEGSGPMRPPCW